MVYIEEKMEKLSLLFGIHMHQPVDNFDKAVKKAVELSYAPFFETMHNYPQFKFSLHCSGWLLEKIRQEYPKLFKIMQELTQKGTIEWFGGGYYEPIISSIPSKDRQAQINKLSRYLKKYFDADVKGLWLTERVWESSIIHDLVACGIEYVMVDDYHFISNGYDKEQMNGYYLSEESGEVLKLFPISQKLRYALPFSKIEDSLKSLLSYAKKSASAGIFFDDAEKFGLWPHTYEWVYEKQWLQKFVEAVLKNEQCQTEHYNTYAQKNRPLGLAYLNNCSYVEMGEWSLKTPLASAFKKLKEDVGDGYFQDKGVSLIKGGIWKNFFIKYHESNYLHKRMLQLSKAQKSYDKVTLDALYRLQTNDVFWHGVFGGFYLPNLRDNAYKYLLSIERSKNIKEIAIEKMDIDKDGYKEFKVRTQNLSLVFSLKNGAQLVEFGILDVLFNLQNTIMRREELYHQKILEANENSVQTDTHGEIATIHTLQRNVKSDLKSELVYDSYAKNSFIDHFSTQPFTLENFKNLNFDEVGDFVSGIFTHQKKKFVREGTICVHDCIYPAKLQKIYSFQTDTIRLKSKFKTDFLEKLFFAKEFNLHFAHPDRVTFNGKTISNATKIKANKELIIVDDFTQKVLTFKTNQAYDIFAVPLSTISESEQDFEKIVQQISFLFCGHLKEEHTFEINIKVSDV